MSFTCSLHGWQHLDYACPLCTTTVVSSDKAKRLTMSSRLQELCGEILSKLPDELDTFAQLKQMAINCQKVANAAKKMEWGLENSCCCTGEPLTEICDACIALTEVKKILEE